MILYHVTTPKKMQKYHESKSINKPVRGFTTLTAAMIWAIKTNRQVILKIDTELQCYKLPDHHNPQGEAWWVDGNITEWKCIISPKGMK